MIYSGIVMNMSNMRSTSTNVGVTINAQSRRLWTVIRCLDVKISCANVAMKNSPKMNCPTGVVFPLIQPVTTLESAARAM